MRLTPTMSISRSDVLGAGAVLVITAAALGIGLWPVLAQGKQKAGVSLLNEREQEARAAEAAVRDAETSLRKALDELDSSVRLVSADKTNERLVTFAARAEQFGVTVEQLTAGVPDAGNATIAAAPGASKSAPRTRVVPVRLSGRGSFDAVNAFIGDLHRTFRDTRVSGFKMTASPEAGGYGTYALDLEWFAAPKGSAGER